jgi:peptide/nickel transport system permease protein
MEVSVRMTTFTEIVIPRLIHAMTVTFIVLTVVFFVTRVTSDPIRLMAPITATPEEIAHLRQQAGLNRPLPVQYVSYLADVARLRMGNSFRTGLPATHEVRSRLWPTIELGVAALAISLVFGIALGALAAFQRGKPLDILLRLFALLGQAMPNFWLGLVLIIIFSVKLKWLPTGGSGSVQHLILPAITLAAFSLAAITRLMRSTMIDVLSSDFIRTARAKGLGEYTILIRHALRNGLLPVVTVIGIQVGALISGAIVIETVFSWPGMGRLIIQSINNADYPVIQLIIILISFAIVFANAAVDISYAWLDPRVTG